MRYGLAESLLKKTYADTHHHHSRQGHRYITQHWHRYVTILATLPPLTDKTRVLEVGASILSVHLHKTYSCPVTVLYHELENEWQHRFDQLGITAYPLELMRDSIPVENDSFDVILFNEVMEHFPLHPRFFMLQLFRKLSPRGELLLGVPNFATSEKRLQLLLGQNPQDQMDEQFIYYAHHREPVMDECVDLVNSCGGIVVEKRWCECDGDPAPLPVFKRLLFHLYRRRIHPLLHALIPGMRRYILIHAMKDQTCNHKQHAYTPPLSQTRELARKYPSPTRVCRHSCPNT
ncbi:MAG: class I SAM-dependent methyltransferase [Chitinivibrionales bacterium]